MEFLQGNHFDIGVSERKGDHSVTAVLERKSFARRPFCSQFLERKGNGCLYGGMERNHSNQIGLLENLKWKKFYKYDNLIFLILIHIHNNSILSK